MWKWLLGILIVAAVVCGGGGYFFAATEKGRSIIRDLKPQAEPTEVRIEAVRRGSLTRVVSAPGTIEPKRRVDISAQVSAKIVALPFKEGSAVRKGDVVVRLDSDDYAAALASAQASLRAEEARLDGAKAGFIEAQANFGRIKKLFESGDISKDLYDQAESGFLRSRSNLSAAESGVEIARANITRAEKNLAFCTISAPIDGTITRLNNEVGEQVLGTFNNAGSVIMEIADLSEMVMNAKVDEANVGPVRVGQAVKVFVSSEPDRVFQGKVQLVGLKKLLDRDGTGYFETEIAVEHTEGDKLRSGLNANCDIEVEVFSDVLRVPSQAVVDRRVEDLPKEIAAAAPQVDRNKVFARVVYRIAENGRTIASPVAIGPSDLTETIILSGLEEGQKIVTGPFRVLTDLKHDQEVVELGTLKKDGKNEPAQAGSTGTGAGRT